MMNFLTKLLFLFAGHAICDFSLQTDFIAKGKNLNTPFPGMAWQQIMLAHCLAHMGMVLLITGNPWMALAELVIHFNTDYAKCAGLFGTGNKAFNIDQFIHYACKVLWAVL